MTVLGLVAGLWAELLGGEPPRVADSEHSTSSYKSRTANAGASLRTQDSSAASSGRPWKVDASTPFRNNWNVGSFETECSSANASLSSASIRK